MTRWHVVLGVVFYFFLWYGWWLAHRRPWDGKLGPWDLDRVVRRAKRKYKYWPNPEVMFPSWIRPQKAIGHDRAYCLRCGRWPFTGPELMYKEKEGRMFICRRCSVRSVTTEEELLMYAHRMMDILICQNFDPHITHPDDMEPITYFIEMWEGMKQAVYRLEASR
jgi:hypothetical protein